MKLTGVEVPVATLSKIEPNTVLVVLSDDKGETRVIKVDRDSIPTGESFLRVSSNTPDDGQPQAGCWIRINGYFIWVDPCPY